MMDLEGNKPTLKLLWFDHIDGVVVISDILDRIKELTDMTPLQAMHTFFSEEKCGEDLSEDSTENDNHD